MEKRILCAYSSIIRTNPIWVKGGQMDILLVEDNSDDVELTLRTLRKHRLTNQIHVVRDGPAAVELAQSNTEVGLILLDIILPSMSGFGVLRRLQANSNSRAIPVIILPDSKDCPSIVEGVRLGARGFMVKPVNFNKLMEATCALKFRWLLSDLSLIHI